MPVKEAAVSSGMDSLIAPYRDQIADEMNEVVAECVRPLYKQSPEGALGNWVADAVKTEAEKSFGAPLDFAIQNSGGIRIPELPIGPVPVGKLYELMPFDNLITVLELDGESLEQLFRFMADGGGWPVSREVRYEISGDEARAVTINGRPLDPRKVYAFALPDYVADGGGHAEFLMDLADKRTDLSLLVRDALILHARDLTAQGKKIDGTIEGRVTRSQ